MGGANLNALVLMAAVAFVTLLFVVVFMYKLSRFLLCTVALTFALCWGGFFGYLVYRLTLLYPAPFDILTLALLSLQVAAVGVGLVFALEPSGASDFALVWVACAASWPMACFSELTVLFFLIDMVVYDLAAVLLPCGPLAYVMREQQRRVWMGEDDVLLPPGMEYVTPLYRLGLGDFCFFAAALARFCQVGVPMAACGAEAMLAACVFTVSLTTALDRTIPALPLALSLGFMFYFMGVRRPTPACAY